MIRKDWHLSLNCIYYKMRFFLLKYFHTSSHKVLTRATAIQITNNLADRSVNLNKLLTKGTYNAAAITTNVIEIITGFSRIQTNYQSSLLL